MSKRLIGSGISYASIKMMNKSKRFICSECGDKYTTYENAELCHDREVVV